MIQPGTYLGTIISHSISETKSGNPQAVVAFTLETPTGPQKITYYGSFSEKAQQYTIKNLITCGLKGNNPAGDLEIGKQVELVIDIEVGEDNKERNKVKFINKVGGTRNVIAPDLAKAKLSALEGAVMSVRSTLPPDDEIPF